MSTNQALVVVKGAGDLASGIAYRLYKCGLKVIMTEIERPLVVRRTVSFAEAVHEGSALVEDVNAKLAVTDNEVLGLLRKKIIPVVVDPKAGIIKRLEPSVVVDARMAKRNLGTCIDEAPLVIGLGPGFAAGVDTHAVIETCRGHTLGRVIYRGSAIPNTGVPGAIAGQTWTRLLRAPVDGIVRNTRAIGEQISEGDVVASVGDVSVHAAVSGIIRGVIREGTWVSTRTKIGDIDPRLDTDYNTISDKALAVAGGVLEAVFHFLSQYDKS